MEFFSSAEDLKLWILARASSLAMVVEPCTLDDLQPEWIADSDSIRSADGRFFSVEGRHIVQSSGREASGWKQPIIADEPLAFAAIIRTLSSKWYLVRAKAEPGNVGIKIDGTDSHVLFAPPVQFSQGNFENHQKALCGELDQNGQPYHCVPFASAALPVLPEWAHSARWESTCADGARFDRKIVNLGCISVKSPDHLADELALSGSAQDFVWVSLPVLRHIRQVGWANGLLVSTMGLLV